MSNNTDKVIALFVEGGTDFEFYKALIANFRELSQTRFSCCFEYKDMRGIGNYKHDALRRLNEITDKHKNAKVCVFLCYDTDAFDFGRKPPVNMNEVKKLLLDNGAAKVVLIEAKYSIEDWFLLDYNGVLRYLRLPSSTKKEAGKGQDIIKKLFKRSNRLYLKGGSVDGFVDALNISTIRNVICPVIKPLCRCIGLNCSTICGKTKQKRTARN